MSYSQVLHVTCYNHLPLSTSLLNYSTLSVPLMCLFLVLSSYHVLSYILFSAFFQTSRPSTAHWQLDKWLQKSQRKSSSSDKAPSTSAAGRLPSPHPPSPLRSWDSNQEYSPSQSPIPSPRLSYSNNNTPLPSPGYSYCPSPSPFPSTCPSPSPSPRHSSIPSPVPSVCPSPCGSPQSSRSLSPISRDPPKSPSPSLPSPSRQRHYPESQTTHRSPQQSSQGVNLHRTKIRSRTAPVVNSDSRNKVTNSSSGQLTSHHRPKTQPVRDKDQNPTKSKTSAVLTSDPHHCQKNRPKSDFNPKPKQIPDAPKAKHSLHFENIQSNKSNHSSSHKPRPTFRPSSQVSPSRTRQQGVASCEANTSHSSYSQCTSKSKQWKATAPTAVHDIHAKTSERRPHSKEREVDYRRDRQSKVDRSKEESKEDRHRDKQRRTQDRKEDRRLAEEQLLRRSWIHTSEEEEEEEEEDGVLERLGRRREEVSKGENRRKEQQTEWQSVQTKQRLFTGDKQQRNRDNSHLDRATKKGGTSEKAREPHQDPLPSHPSHSPTPHKPSSSSSSSSSNSDSESEYQVPVGKVPPDSTSQKSLRKSGPNRPNTNRAEEGHSRGPISARSSDGKQKLYTLVPFGRSDQTAVPSNRGLRNLVVQIDLCLLKRVPDNTANPTVKNPSATSTVSSSAKDKQKEAMKHLHIPESKRKRKVHNRTECVLYL